MPVAQRGPAWPGATDRQDWQLGVASLHGPLTASSELCRLMGIRQLDFGGTKEAFLQIVHEEDRDRVGQALNAILDERKPCDIDHRIILPNGGEFTVNLQAEAVFDDQLKAVTIVGTAKDISERKCSEREIHRLAYYDSLTGLRTVCYSKIVSRKRLPMRIATNQLSRSCFST
jgi:PAS domain S-box-containing protein